MTCPQGQLTLTPTIKRVSSMCWPTRLLAIEGTSKGVRRRLCAHVVASVRPAERIVVRHRGSCSSCKTSLLLRVGPKGTVRAKDCGTCSSVDMLEQRRRAVGRVIVNIDVGAVVLADLVVAPREEGPEDLDQGEQENDTRGDCDRDENDYTRSEEVCTGESAFTNLTWMIQEWNLRVWSKLKVAKEWNKEETEPGLPD